MPTLRSIILLICCLITHPAFATEEAVTWRVITGVKQSNTESIGKEIRQVSMLINTKTFELLFGNNETYLKLIDPSSKISFIEPADLQALPALIQKIQASADGDEQTALLQALEVLTMWPANLPVYLWMDSQESISPVNAHTFAIKSVGTLQAKSTQNDTNSFFEINNNQLLSKLTREFPRLDSETQAVNARNIRPRSATFCNAIGSIGKATYPDELSYGVVTSPNPFAPNVKGVTQWKSVDSMIEPWWNDGGSCTGRCGSGCDGLVFNLKSQNDSYSQACLDHDVCTGDKGLTADQCNYIFQEAVNDYLNQFNCTALTLEGPDIVTANATFNYVTTAQIGSLRYDISTLPGLQYSYSCSDPMCLVNSWSANNGLISANLPGGTYSAILTTTFSKHGLTRSVNKKIQLVK